MKSMAEDELQQARERATALELDLQKLLLPKDPHDNSNIFLEIRAGTGGENNRYHVGKSAFSHIYIRTLKNNNNLF